MFEFNRWFDEGVRHFELGRFQESIECYDRALEIFPLDTNILCNKGNALSKLGKYSQALACYEKALEIDNDDEVVWLNKGGTFYGMKRYEQAIACFDEALRIAPVDPDIWAHKASALYAMGELDKSIECLVQAGNFGHPDAENLLKSAAREYIKKGINQDQLGNLDEAVFWFDKALAIDAEYADSWFNKGAVLYNSGNT